MIEKAKMAYEWFLANKEMIGEGLVGLLAFATLIQRLFIRTEKAAGFITRMGQVIDKIMDKLKIPNRGVKKPEEKKPE